MKKLLPRALTACAAISLVLWVGVVALWLRSYRVFDLRGREGRTSPAGRRSGGNVSSAAGRLAAEYWVRDIPGTPPAPGTDWGGFSQPLRPGQDGAREQYLASIGARRFLGVAWASYRMNPLPGPPGGGGGRGGGAAATETVTHLELPYPYPAAALAVLPALWLWRRWRGRRRIGHCPACGYDLTGNVSGRCPECGEVVASRAAPVRGEADKKLPTMERMNEPFMPKAPSLKGP